MKRILSLIALLSFFTMIFAQLGINTITPQSTLDIRGKNHLGPVAADDGILVPRVSDLTTNGTVNGQLVYYLGNPKGFYYWEDSQWVQVSYVSPYKGSIITKQPLIVADVAVILNSADQGFSLRYSGSAAQGHWQIRYNGTGTRDISVFVTEHWVSAGYSVQAATATLNAGVWNNIPGSTQVGSPNELNIFRIYDLDTSATMQFEGMLINKDGQLKESMILQEF